jgi:hypothetical protein
MVATATSTWLGRINMSDSISRRRKSGVLERVPVLVAGIFDFRYTLPGALVMSQRKIVKNVAPRRKRVSLSINRELGLCTKII